MKNRQKNKPDKYRDPLDDGGAAVPWILVAPALIIIALFGLIPFFNTIRLSFTNATMLRPGHFVAWDNYVKIFHDSRVITALTNSSLYVVCVVPLLIILPLILASLVAGQSRIMNFFRTSFYLPVVMSSVVIGLIWTNLLGTRGLINGMFKALKWIQKPIPFLTDRWLLLFSAMTITIWTGLGYYMVIYLAAMANIDPSLYEAAEIDGAGVFGRFIHITMPGVKSTMLLILFLSSIAAFRVFNEVYVLTNGTGGVGGADLTMSMLIKNEGTGLQGRTGYSGAISMLMFVILGGLVVVENLVQRKLDKDA